MTEPERGGRQARSLALNDGYLVISCSYDEVISSESLYLEIFENGWIDGIIFSGAIRDNADSV